MFCVSTWPILDTETQLLQIFWQLCKIISFEDKIRCYLWRYKTMKKSRALRHFISPPLFLNFSDMTEMMSCLQTLSTHFKTQLRGRFPRQRHQTSDDSISKCILQFSDVPRNCSVEAKTFLNQNEKWVKVSLSLYASSLESWNFISYKREKNLFLSPKMSDSCCCCCCRSNRVLSIKEK